MENINMLDAFGQVCIIMRRHCNVETNTYDFLNNNTQLIPHIKDLRNAQQYENKDTVLHAYPA